MSNTAKLRILTEIDYPNVNECFNYRNGRPTTECQMPGIYVEIINLLTKNLNITTQFVRMEELERPSNLTIHEFILESVRTGTVDTYAEFFDNSSVYGPGFDVSEPIYYSRSSFVAAPAKNLSGVFAFFTVYDIYTWMLIFGTMIAFMFVGFLICRGIAPRINRVGGNLSFGQLSWRLVRLELLQYEAIKEKLLSINALILVFALLNCGLLIQMYNNLITTRTVRHFDPKPFKQSEIFKLLKEKKYSLMFPNRFWRLYQEIKTSQESPFFELRQSLAENPIQIAQEIEGVDDDHLETYVLDQIQKGNWLSILTNQAILKSRQWGYCNLVYLETGIRPRNKHILMRKNHPLLRLLNQAILNESIHIRRLYNKYYVNARPSPKCVQIKNGPKPLTLTPFFGVLILLSVGLSTALFSFFIELWLKSKMK